MSQQILRSLFLLFLSSNSPTSAAPTFPDIPVFLENYSPSTQLKSNKSAFSSKAFSMQVDDFCGRQNGKMNYKIQNSITVDCFTGKTLWKVVYSDKWSEALTEAMQYGIYDNYQGSPDFAPVPGIALIQRNSQDYKNAVKLKQLIKYYALPIQLTVIENPISTAPTSNAESILKNVKFQFTAP